MITNTKGLTINKSILHIINSNNTHHYNKSLLPNNDTKFNEFLKKHIRSALGTKYRKTAKFKNTTYNIIRDDILNLFNNDQDFIDYSISIAQRLVDLCKVKSKNPFDLVICEYENGDNETYVAILLLEYTTNFFHELDENATEAHIQHITSLSSSNSVFRKSAIIKPINIDLDFDLIISDRKPSDFFSNDFLCSYIFVDNREATERFVEGTIGWVNKQCNDPSLHIDIKNSLNKIKSNCISLLSENNIVNIDGFIDLNFSGELEGFRESYRTHLERTGLITNEINLDESVTKDYKYQKIKLENDIEIKVPIAIINDDAYNGEYSETISENSTVSIKINGRKQSESVKLR